jgi:hypothetical protein
MKKKIVLLFMVLIVSFLVDGFNNLDVNKFILFFAISVAMGFFLPQILMVSSLYNKKNIYKPHIFADFDVKNPLVFINFFSYLLLTFGMGMFVKTIVISKQFLNFGLIFILLFVAIQISVFILHKIHSSASSN